MEAFIVIVCIVLIYTFITNLLEKNNATSPLNQIQDIDILTKDDDIEVKDEKKEVTNNVYIQNTVNIQINERNSDNNRSSSKRHSPNKDHTEKIWNEMGYKIKHGEKYSYKMYGKKIFKPFQVIKKNTYNVKYSERGLAKKLLEQTGSKKMTQNILVKQYQLSTERAKELVYKPSKNLSSLQERQASLDAIANLEF